ncbi:Myosin-IIIa, partial [Marasmius crinis-equi]
MPLRRRQPIHHSYIPRRCRRPIHCSDMLQPSTPLPEDATPRQKSEGLLSDLGMNEATTDRKVDIFGLQHEKTSNDPLNFLAEILALAPGSNSRSSQMPYKHKTRAGVSADLDSFTPSTGLFPEDADRRLIRHSYNELGGSVMDDSVTRRPLVITEDGKPPMRFRLDLCIGQGPFGSVYYAINTTANQAVVVKRISLEYFDSQEVTQLVKDVESIKQLSHPRLVKCQGVAHDADSFSLVLEYAEKGSLAKPPRSSCMKMSERQVAKYVVHILNGLHYLHTNNVVHGNLKATNVLITTQDNIKLSDYGLSLNTRADLVPPNWMAPEVIRRRDNASPKSDIWSLACTITELLTGRPPYGDLPSSIRVTYQIVNDDCPPMPPSCSPLLETFLKQCLSRDPAQRPTADLLRKHPWLKQNWDIQQECPPQDTFADRDLISSRHKIPTTGDACNQAQAETPDSHRRIVGLLGGPVVSLVPRADRLNFPLGAHFFSKTKLEIRKNARLHP